jgi:hypothetical protein
MFVLTPSAIALCLCVPLLAYFLVKWACSKDTEAENRRRAAAKLASKLQAIGLRKLPDFLIDYSVGDFAGMANKIHAVSELFLAGDEPLLAEVDTVFRNVLDAKLKTEEGRALVAAKLAEATKAVAPVVAAAVPAVAAVAAVV